MSMIQYIQQHLKGILLLAMFIVLTVWGCRKPFIPDVSKENRNVLVVEGTINTGTDSTIIYLGRTIPIEKGTGVGRETGATVTVENETNANYPLTEIKPGIYGAPALGLIPTGKYRLRIQTKDGKVYLSELVTGKVAPAIDDVEYTVGSDGVRIFVSTHDDSNNTKYYRWDYKQTYEFNALYESLYLAEADNIRGRTSTENVYHCWANKPSTEVLINSSARLSKDLIYRNPLVFIPANDERISIKYSILVNQYALTREAYEFWENMKRNNESIGSIFDTQPFDVGGNIKNVADAAEPVIGFITAGVPSKKRIFIDRTQLPPVWKMAYPYNCSPVDSLTLDDARQILIPKIMIPVDAILSPTGLIVGYTASAKECTDCTIRGTTRKPDFWP